MMKSLMVVTLSCFLTVAQCSDLNPFLNRGARGACEGNELFVVMERCYGRLLALTELPGNNPQLLKDVHSLCKTVPTSNQCFQQEMQPCGPSGQMTAAMLENVFSYVCGSGRTVLLSQGNCWGHETLKADIGECTRIMEEKLATQGFNAWCSLSNEFIACLGERVKEKTECPEKAAIFVQELFGRSMKPAADVMHCQLRIRTTRDLVNFWLQR